MAVEQLSLLPVESRLIGFGFVNHPHPEARQHGNTTTEVYHHGLMFYERPDGFGGDNLFSTPLGTVNVHRVDLKDGRRHAFIGAHMLTGDGDERVFWEPDIYDRFRRPKLPKPGFELRVDLAHNRAARIIQRRLVQLSEVGLGHARLLTPLDLVLRFGTTAFEAFGMFEYLDRPQAAN